MSNYTKERQRRRGTNVFKVKMPHTDFAGLCDNATVNPGDFLTFSGSLVRSAPSPATSCVPVMAFNPVLVMPEIAHTITILAEFIDHLGNRVKRPFTKSNVNMQTWFTPFIVAEIISIQVIAMSNPGTRIRMGFCWCGYTKTSTDLDTRNTTVVGGNSRRIPLPVALRNAGELIGVFAPLVPVSQILTSVGVGATTFTATTAVVTSWTGIASALIGDLVYTSDGYCGSLSSNGGTVTDTLTLGAGWVNRLGVAGTPANGSTVYVHRSLPGGNTAGLFTFDINGGLGWGRRVITSPNTTLFSEASNGVDTNSQTVNFRPQAYIEPATPLTLDVILAVGAANRAP